MSILMSPDNTVMTSRIGGIIFFFIVSAFIGLLYNIFYGQISLSSISLVVVIGHNHISTKLVVCVSGL